MGRGISVVDASTGSRHVDHSRELFTAQPAGGGGTGAKRGRGRAQGGGQGVADARDESCVCVGAEKRPAKVPVFPWSCKTRRARLWDEGQASQHAGLEEQRPAASKTPAKIKRGSPGNGRSRLILSQLIDQRLNAQTVQLYCCLPMASKHYFLRWIIAIIWAGYGGIHPR